MKLDRTLKMGMLGGGPGAFIGEVHRKAARMDGHIEVVAGAFDIDPKKSRQMGRQLCLDPKRVYGDYKEMLRKELKLPLGKRIDFVAITTPNNWHYPMAKDFLNAGFHIMCEKPITMTSKEAKDLQKLVKKTRLVFGLMHTYTGYPMVKEARDMVRTGKLGKIRKIVAEYPQGWLSTPLEKTGNMQASWRTDPKQSGGAGCMGDIGVHAANLAEYITGLRITDICADLSIFVKGRRLDDDGNCIVRFNKGVRGVLYASQVSAGEENGLAIRIYGTEGGLKWVQLEPNTLTVYWLDKPAQIIRAGANYSNLCKAAREACRLPCGHPEGFFESMANHYCNFAGAVRCRLEGKKVKPEYLDFPNVDDGVRGMLFIESVLRSTKSKQKWFKMKK